MVVCELDLLGPSLITNKTLCHLSIRAIGLGSIFRGPKIAYISRYGILVQYSSYNLLHALEMESTSV